MPRPALFKDSVRVNLTFDRHLLVKMRKLAKGSRKTISETIRDVMRDYLEGILVRQQKDISRLVKQIKKVRSGLPPSKIDSTALIRAWRDTNWKWPRGSRRS